MLFGDFTIIYSEEIKFLFFIYIFFAKIILFIKNAQNICLEE
jgi:hypothetical protein